jgi:hypothetical protein
MWPSSGGRRVGDDGGDGVAGAVRHKGQAGTGGGNHRGSIFRFIVGAALIRRDGRAFPSWGSGNTATRQRGR